jgi:small subunit ribosomal protein S1
MKRAAPNMDASQDLMATLLDQYLDTNRCRRGDIVKGVIVSVNPKAILIDIGGKCDATVHPREIERMTPQDFASLKPGQDINVYVVEPNSDNEMMLVSLSRAAQENDWDRARKMMKNNEIVSLQVIDANKGGVIVRLGALRGFVPGSQLLPTWQTHQNSTDSENRWANIMGKTLTLRIIEVTAERNRLILSERGAADNKAIKRKILEKLEVGSVHKGVVNNIVPFGAFVNVNGIDGLLHISELSWKRVNNPKEVVHVGQKLDVYILDVDLEKNRLGLSLKRIKSDPWESIAQEYKEGQLIDVKIVNLTTFGAFAALTDKPEVEGLIHISELSNQQIAHPEEVVKVGEQHTVRIISLQAKGRRVAFSLKQVTEARGTDTDEDKPESDTPDE